MCDMYSDYLKIKVTVLPDILILVLKKMGGDAKRR